MLANSRSPWQPFGRAPGSSMVPDGRWIAGRLRPVPRRLRCAALGAGLKPSGPETVAAASGLFVRAAELIAQLPDLHEAVEAAVMHVHPLDALPGYDVSHSEPRWKRTVFVSIPERGDTVGALRLAEGIAHECMHLLLTEWESVGAFVAEIGAMMHSPWRGTARPVQGVLHGTFVFVCIAAFLSQLPGSGLGRSGRDHVAQRLLEISAELGTIDVARLRSLLTPRGASYLDRWTTADRPGLAGSCPAPPGRDGSRATEVGSERDDNGCLNGQIRR